MEATRYIELRSNENTPAQNSIRHYFSHSTSPRFRARRRVTLPVRLSQDIEMVRKYDLRFSRDFPSFYKLSWLADLTAITQVAEARKKWQQLVNCKL